MKPIQKQLQGLVSAAEQKPGQTPRLKLSNNLLVECKIVDHVTQVQISRSTSYPCPDDWMIVVRWWPYPIPLQEPRQARAHGRHYLTASWPTPARLVVTDPPPGRQPVVTKLLDVDG